MINELRVRDYGVIADVDVILDEGMTAITGETGAGKTLIVDALEQLLGGRPASSMVRSGAAEALIEGHFFHNDDEIAVVRTIPKSGRARSTLNGTLSTTGALEDLGWELVDFHGQNTHQSLLRLSEQRLALDRFAGVDLEPLNALRATLRSLKEELEELGGDDRLRAREIDLVRYELNEIDVVGIESVSEEEELAREQEILENSADLRMSSAHAYELLSGGDVAGVRDLLAKAMGVLIGKPALQSYHDRLRSLCAEIDDVANDLRQELERFEEQPERLAEILERRTTFGRLKKKHGDSLSDVLEARQELAHHLEVLQSTDARRSAVLAQLSMLESKIREEEQRVGDLRRQAAPGLSERVETHLRELGLERARLTVEVPAGGFGDAVRILLAANPGEEYLPLAKAASGGELARVMLALRLVLSARPSTLVFDEVDAGVGGEAALAVGRALRQLGRDHQVIVVTHLAQVAAFADNQLAVRKYDDGDRTYSEVIALEGEHRVAELARMLSGHPDSKVARQHAAELLDFVASERLNQGEFHHHLNPTSSNPLA